MKPWTANIYSKIFNHFIVYKLELCVSLISCQREATRASTLVNEECLNSVCELKTEIGFYPTILNHLYHPYHSKPHTTSQHTVYYNPQRRLMSVQQRPAVCVLLPGGRKKTIFALKDQKAQWFRRHTHWASIKNFPAVLAVCAIQPTFAYVPARVFDGGVAVDIG